MKNLQLFDQNYGLNTLNKCQFCGFPKSMFLLSRKACFLRERHQILFFGVFFDQNHGLTPLEKCKFCVYFKPMFSRKPCFLSKTSKIVFFTIYSHDLLHQHTEGYETYKGWPRVTGGYRGLQEVTRGYSGLQINFFITRKSLETFFIDFS